MDKCCFCKKPLDQQTLKKKKKEGFMEMLPNKRGMFSKLYMHIPFILSNAKGSIPKYHFYQIMWAEQQKCHFHSVWKTRL